MFRDVVHAYDRIEDQLWGESLQRQLCLGPRPPREQREFKALVEPLQGARPGDPLLPHHEPALAQKNGLKVLLYIFEFGRHPRLIHDVMRELPVVIPAAPILISLNLFIADARAREM